MMLKNLLFIILTSVFVNNYVLTKFLGVCPFLGVSKKLKEAVGMGFAVTFVMVIATGVTWPIQYFILEKYNLNFLQTIVFILVIATLVQLVETILKKSSPTLHAGLGIYLPLITTNCAVLGITINNIKDEYNFLESVFSAFGCGVGFLLALVLFAGVRTRLESENIPTCFKGLPITLIAASYVALAFSGFSGIIENIFG